MVGRFKQALLEKGKMPKKFSVKSGDKSAEGGLTAKGVKRYRAANPGSKLKTAVTTKPSKLKKGSKSAKRRKSFCARMGGMKKRMTSAKTRRDPTAVLIRLFASGIALLTLIPMLFNKSLRELLRLCLSRSQHSETELDKEWLEMGTAELPLFLNRRWLRMKRGLKPLRVKTQ